MDFFQEQDAARRNTRWLVVLFLLAVVAIVVALYLALILIIAFSGTSTTAQPIVLWQPELFAVVAVVVSVVILLSSTFKVIALSRGGGTAVAESLGGRLVNRSTEDRLERRLLNVVDEMAIASGIPVPRVYVLEDESGINAFAAGTSTSDAVVAVTRGTLEQLNRDELQGVVGHEFSHIFNGDMRLNIRLMGVLHGILMLALIGRSILRGSSRGSRHRGYHSSSSNRGKGGGGIVLFAIALFVVGYIGVFFGRLIKAAVSRQREFLADASAVQFTRNPSGIAGALKKIACFESTRIEHPDAESASHMFFGNGINTFLSLLATHPPVEERIDRLDPYFRIGEQATAIQTAPDMAQADTAMGFAAGGTASIAVTAEEVRSSVGNFDKPHLNYAKTLLEKLPETVWKAVREPQGAHAIVLAMAVAKEKVPGDILKTALPQLTPELTEMTLEIASQFDVIERADWLPLIELAIPALEELPQQQLMAVPEEVDSLIRADKRVTLFEFSLATLLRHTLIQRDKTKRQGIKGGIKQLNKDVIQMLSLMVHVGHKDASMAQQAFEQAINAFGQDGEFTLVERSRLSLKAIEESLGRLARLNFRFKGKVIEAATTAITADGEVKVSELDFLRAIGASLDCPIPPLQVGIVTS